MVTQAKKVVDAWKAKKWYTVIAPNFLNNIEAAEVPSQEDGNLVNRIIEIPLKEITREISHMYTSIKLRISEIKGKKAYSKFIGHSVAREYLRTLVRRRRDVIETVFMATSKDGVEFRVKAMAVTENRCSGEQKHALRTILRAEVEKKIKAMEFGEFVKHVLFSKVSDEIQAALSKIMPVRRVEIWKTELKEDFDTEQQPEPAQPKAEAAPAEEEEVAPEAAANPV